MQRPGTKSPASALSPLALVGALAGGLLFAYTLHAAGPAKILEQIARVGPAFALVLLLSGLRMAVRAGAWSLCMDRSDRLSFREAFVAFVSGDALGNVTPLGPLASESAKAMLLRRRHSTGEAVSSVVLENIFYSLSVAAMVGVGTLAFILGFRLDSEAETLSLIVGAAAVIAAVTVWWLLSSQPKILSRFFAHDAIVDAEARIFGFVAARRDRLGRILLLEFSFHAAAVMEIYLLLALLLGHSSRTLLMAIVLEAVERVITIAFKFVPLRLGVDQAGSGLVAQIIGAGSTTGVTIATVRTARNLCWAAVGLTLLLKRGVSRAGAPASTPQ